MSSLIDDIRKALQGEKKNGLITQILNEQAFYDALHKVGLTVSVADPTERGRVLPYGVLSKVQKIEIDKVATFGEVGVWIPFTLTGTGDLITPPTGYYLKVLSAFYYCRNDIVTELRFKNSGMIVLGLPTMGSIGMNPLSVSKPEGVNDEALELYMSASGIVKGWIVVDELIST